MAGSGAKYLAKKLSQNMKLELVHSVISNFSDGEIKIQVPDLLYNQDTVIVQSISTPVNDRLVEFLLLVDAARRAGSKRIIAVVPYLGYSRQDRCTYQHGPISAALVASLVEIAGVDHIVTVDLHSKQIEGFFKKALIYNIEALEVFKDSLSSSKDIVVISPDIGGIIRARKISDFLGASLAVINKVRDKSDDSVTMDQVIGDIRGKDCIIIDDIVDSGKTLSKAAGLLIQNGASKVEAYITHGVLSGAAINLIQNSVINQIYITDSIEHSSPLPLKFVTISIANVLSAKLQLMV